MGQCVAYVAYTRLTFGKSVIMYVMCTSWRLLSW